MNEAVQMMDTLETEEKNCALTALVYLQRRLLEPIRDCILICPLESG